MPDSRSRAVFLSSAVSVPGPQPEVVLPTELNALPVPSDKEFRRNDRERRIKRTVGFDDELERVVPDVKRNVHACSTRRRGQDFVGSSRAGRRVVALR